MEEAIIIHQYLNQNSSAIRQFCPARIIEQEQQCCGTQQQQQFLLLDDEEQEQMDFDFNFNLTPQFIDDETPQSDLEQIVDTFFDLDCYLKDNADNESFDFDLFEKQSIQQNSPIDLRLTSIEEDELLTDDFSTDLVDQGLYLVHLLLACAEAVGCRDIRLADSILNQILPRVSPFGDSLQRVSHCFAMGLRSRLCNLQNGSFVNRVGVGVCCLVTREEKSEAFELLCRTTPYVEFGYVAANDAIVRASMGKDRLHVVDLGMECGLQWPSLVNALASRNGGPPKTIRITGIIGDQDPLKLEISMKGLVEEAYFYGIHLEFCIVDEPVSPLTLTREKLDIKEGEALFVNSIMHLHKHVKESRGSLKTVLQSIKKLNPILLTVVEQDANHNGPFFLGRFLESLHYYSAIFDSIEASLPQDAVERMKIEKFHFAEEIRNVVAYEGSDRIERHERACQWRRQLGRAGFQAVGLKCLDRVEEMVSSYGCDGYTVGSEKGCLQLGWKGRAIMLASAWQVNNVGSG